MKNFFFINLFKTVVGVIIFPLFTASFTANGQQYCMPTSDCTMGDQIENFSTTGAIVNISNLGSGCSTNGYGDFTSTHSMTVAPGTTFNISVQTLPTSPYDQGFTIWIDWNQDGDFTDPGEMVWNSGTWGTQIFTGTITVPPTAMSGTTRMRVMAGYYCIPSNPCSNCDIYGETEDYSITISGSTDAGLEHFITLADTICDGDTPVEVLLKNHGPNFMSSVDIEWSVNNTPQTVHNWSGSLPVDSSTIVTIGSFNFVYGTSYDITAYTDNPNNNPDTVNHNDTIYINSMVVEPSPFIILDDTLVAICEGDTAIISGTLYGRPPWDLIINDGTGDIPVTNITDSAFSISFTPTSHKTYNITHISDATDCDDKNIYTIDVSVQAAPPSSINATYTEACEGDSIPLMGSIGMNFSYKWYVDGVLLPGDTNYVCHAKVSGDYTVLVISPIGCSRMSSPVTVTIFPEPEVFIGNDTAILPSHTITLDAGPDFESYSWSTGETTQTITVDTSGTGEGVKTVWVVVTDDNDCEGTDTIKINFTEHLRVTDIYPNAKVNIFPNPTKGLIDVNMQMFPAGNYEIDIYNFDGRLLNSFNHSLSSNDEIFDLDLGHLSNGIYFLKVRGEIGELSSKIIIHR